MPEYNNGPGEKTIVELLHVRMRLSFILMRTLSFGHMTFDPEQRIGKLTQKFPA